MNNHARISPETVLVDRLLAGNPRPIAVFLAADTLAPGFYAELQRRGAKAGEDLDVIGCNNERQLLAPLSPLGNKVTGY
jgi:DNA-binding LacI/PurR family transcriptional regulator